MSKDGSLKGRKILPRVYLTVLIVVLAGGGFLAWKYYDLRKQNRLTVQKLNAASKDLATYKTDPNQAAQAEADQTVAKVAKLYGSLPKDEKPSVASVKDKTKLTDQPFFAKAENGDVTLIYPNAKVAVLYRPSTNQIINVSSVSIQNQAQPAPTP